MRFSRKLILRGLRYFGLIILILIGSRIILDMLIKPDPIVLTSEEEELLAQAVDLHYDALLIDGHNDVLIWVVDYEYELGMDGDEPEDRSPFLYAGGPFTWLPFPPQGEEVRAQLDLARVREGGLDAQFFSIWVDCSFYEAGTPGGARQRALKMIEALQLQARRYPGAIEVAYTAQDVQRITSEGKLAALMGLEGGHAIEDDLEILRRFYESGIRYMTLTHNCSHNWADSSSDEGPNGGLTEFGREVIREMNRLGMIVDVSHVSDETFWDVLEVTRAPIIASHSNARSIADHPRNLTDDMIRAIAANDGVVMVNFMVIYLDPEKTPEWKFYSGWHWFTHPGGTSTPLPILVDHIDHIVQIAGINHVGLGSDFDGAPFLPEGLQDVSNFPNITVELMSRGYSEEDIHKILGGNVLRVLEEVEDLAEDKEP